MQTLPRTRTPFLNIFGGDSDVAGTGVTSPIASTVEEVSRYLTPLDREKELQKMGVRNPGDIRQDLLDRSAARKQSQLGYGAGSIVGMLLSGALSAKNGGAAVSRNFIPATAALKAVGERGAVEDEQDQRMAIKEMDKFYQTSMKIGDWNRDIERTNAMMLRDDQRTQREEDKLDDWTSSGEFTDANGYAFQKMTNRKGEMKTIPITDEKGNRVKARAPGRDPFDELKVMQFERALESGKSDMEKTALTNIGKQREKIAALRSAKNADPKLIEVEEGNLKSERSRYVNGLLNFYRDLNELKTAAGQAAVAIPQDVQKAAQELGLLTGEGGKKVLKFGTQKPKGL